MMSHRHARNARPLSGFTLVEVLVAVSVVAILAALAAPALRDFANEQRLAATMGALVTDLNFARVEALKRNARVLLCARAAGLTTCAGSAEWQNGWVVCYDATGDDQCDTAAANDPNPVRVVAPLNGQLRLTGGSGVVRFNPIGSTNGLSTLTLTGSWPHASVRTGTVAASGVVTWRKN